MLLRQFVPAKMSLRHFVPFWCYNNPKSQRNYQPHAATLYTPRQKFSDTKFKLSFRGVNFKITQNQKFVLKDKYIKAFSTPKWSMCVFRYWYAIRQSEHGVCNLAR